jgi:hypothetical protein
MITSRRGFLRSLGVGAATEIAAHWPLTDTSRACIFEPSRPQQDEGFIRLNCNENAYGPSAKTAAVIRSSIGNASRYPHMQYEWLVERLARANHVRPEQVLTKGRPAQQYPPHLFPSLRFVMHLAMPNAKLGAEWIASPFS